jgi:hypothetical protein
MPLHACPIKDDDYTTLLPNLITVVDDLVALRSAAEILSLQPERDSVSVVRERI